MIFPFLILSMICPSKMICPNKSVSTFSKFTIFTRSSFSEQFEACFTNREVKDNKPE